MQVNQWSWQCMSITDKIHISIKFRGNIYSVFKGHIYFLRENSTLYFFYFKNLSNCFFEYVQNISVCQLCCDASLPKEFTSLTSNNSKNICYPNIYHLLQEYLQSCLYRLKTMAVKCLLFLTIGVLLIDLGKNIFFFFGAS